MQEFDDFFNCTQDSKPTCQQPPTVKKTALVVDMSNIVFRAIFSDKNIKRAEDLSVELLRHISLNQILSYIRQIKKRGVPGPNIDVILAFDKGSWRLKSFEFYKWSRRQQDPNASQEDIAFSAKVGECFKQLCAEAELNFPYLSVRVSDAEADDICAWCSAFLPDTHESVILVSSDKDIKQLAIGPVFLMDPQDSKKLFQFKSIEEQTAYVNELIIRGDAGDGIPNILSDPDCFVKKKRQTPLTEKQLGIITGGKHLSEVSTSTVPTGVLDRYMQNQSLIDLRDCTWLPSEIEDAIRTTLEAQAHILQSKKALFYKFLAANGLQRQLSQLPELICEV